MKNRKLLIISFLVVATLVTGVGFAALNGDLILSGNAAFYGSSFIQQQDFPKYLEVSVEDQGKLSNVEVHQNSLNYHHDVRMNVDILDTDPAAETYSDVVVLKITYKDEANPTATLPAITLSKLVANAPVAVGTKPNGKLEMTAKLVERVGAQEVIDLTSGKTLHNGDEVYLVIEIIYRKPLMDNTATPENPDDKIPNNALIADRNVNWTLSLNLHWSMATADPSSNP